MQPGFEGEWIVVARFNTDHAPRYSWTTDNRVTRTPRATTWPIWQCGHYERVGFEGMAATPHINRHPKDITDVLKRLRGVRGEREGA